MDDFQSKSGLDSTQKTGFVLLLVFGVLAIGLGFLQMRNTIYNPFTSRLAQENLSGNSLFDEETRLQSIDTDHDGISDWEELNFYETSPYLPDTDSDGIEDKKEIDLGEDPLCPKGGVCDLEAEIIEQANASALENSLGNDVDTPQDLVSDVAGAEGLLATEEGISATADMEDLLNNPDRVKEMLLATGSVTKEQLAGITNEQILSLVQEIFLEQSQQLEEDTNN